MRTWRQVRRWLFLMVLAGAGFGGSGCKTEDDSSNEATRPWNGPKTWETGIPSDMWERR